MKKYCVWMAALLLLWLVLTCVFLILAPDQVPVHFDINGNVDRMGSKYEYLLCPGIGIFFFVISIFGEKLKMRTAGNEKTAAISMLSIFVFMFVLFCYFMWKALDPSSGDSGSPGGKDLITPAWLAANSPTHNLSFNRLVKYILARPT